MVVAVTGHRPDKLNNEYSLTGPVTSNIRLYLQRCITQLKPSKMISGMALGVDTIWALLALENNIPLIAALPCLKQEGRWPQKSQDLYHEILKNPLVTTHYVTQETYNMTCMQRRNEWLVDNSDLLIGVWDETSGGTKNCIDYAIKAKKKIIYYKFDK